MTNSSARRLAGPWPSRIWLGLLLAGCLALATPRPAAAQTCTAAGPSLLLGTVNPYSTATTSTSGTGTYACINPTTAVVSGYGCFSVGTGTGGTSAASRALALNSVTIQIASGGSSSQDHIGVCFDTDE